MSASAQVPYLKTPLPGPLAKALIENDERFTSPSYTRVYPLACARGYGAVMEDVDGNRFLDFTAGIAVCSTGHCHPRVVAAIQDQAAKLLHMSGTDFYYAPQGDLAKKLAEIAPGSSPKRVFFTNSGAESVEAAFKLARHHTKQSLNQIEYLFRRTVDPHEVAAIIVEPIQGEGGYIVPPPEFHRELKKLAEKHGILYIVDEVQTGMGRTGKMFATEHFGIVPDIICLAKGIASGMPLGAIIASSEIMDWGPGSHASTFGGNPVSCVAALETIKLLESELMQNAAEVGKHLMNRLRELATRHKLIGDVRGIGLFIGMELVKNRETKEHATAEKEQVIQECFRHGLLLLGCGQSTVRFCPPLVITKEQADTAVRILDEVLQANNW
ncbi:MAG: aminotransferase class III-fold pyridoxal phosphate-dependent enzyme [Planctomycetales bacterium]|nr:aminotransferase class III-fold pyridoxal phosphate-dependent enzyme [Planctomycetales bacterium]